MYLDFTLIAQEKSDVINESVTMQRCQCFDVVDSVPGRGSGLYKYTSPAIY